MNGTLWAGIVVLALVILVAAGLAIYGGTVDPPTRHYEQVVPNDSLAH